MAFTQQDLEKLNAAINSGAQSITYADKNITLRSLDEMLRLRELMQAEINGQQPGIQQIVTTHDTGL